MRNRRILLSLLSLRVLSLSRLVSSLFTPSMARRVRFDFIPLWQASHTLQALHHKASLAVAAVEEASGELCSSVLPSRKIAPDREP